MILPHLRICAFAECFVQAQLLPDSGTRTHHSNHFAPANTPIFQTRGMFSLFLLVSSVISVPIVSSSALPSNSELGSSSLNQPAVPEPLGTNSTALQDLESPKLSYNPVCSIVYGRSLSQSSCNNALAKISHVTTPMTFGQRGTGNWDVVLPRRFLSGTLYVTSS